jgi:putative ABC transport system permease protein
MDYLARHIRFAWRQALKNPGFTGIVILTLGLGLGAATMIFNMVDAILLRPLPFQDQDRLVAVWSQNRLHRQDLIEVSLQDYEKWRLRNRVFTDLALASTAEIDLTLAGPEDPRHVRARLVTANFFRLLGVRALHGRTFLPGRDDRPEARTALLSHGLWQSRFGGDPGAVGRTLSLDGLSYTVVGVMPASFDYPAGTEIWTNISDLASSPESHALRIFQAVGRLKPGIGLEEAQRDMLRVSTALSREFPRSYRGSAALLNPLPREILGDTRPALLLLLGAVGLLLLIACANVAGLFLAQAAARQKELALRTALGAPHSHILRQFLTESLLLAVAGAGLGLCLAWGGLQLMEALGPEDIPRLDQVGLDGRAVAFSLAAAFGSALLFGLVSALQSRAPNLAAALKEGGNVSPSRSSLRLRGALVVGEVALSLVLLILAGLVLRSFHELWRTDLGFRPERVLTFRLTLYGAKYSDPRSWASTFQSTVDRLSALPEVEHAAVVLQRPLIGPVGWDLRFSVEGQTPDQQADNPFANFERVSPGYFATLGIPLLRGRDFTGADTPESRRVVIVNRSMAERFWPGQNPLGKRLRWRSSLAPQGWLTVVGVVGDARYRQIETARIDLYVPLRQDPHWAMDVVVRTTGDPLRLAGPAAAAVHAVDSGLPLANLTTLEQEIADSVAQPRLRTLLLSCFAGLSLLLAAVGLYGIMAFTLTQRRQEIGIRIALGASRAHILSLALRQALGLVLTGLALGLAGAALISSSGWLGNLLYKVAPTDILTFAAVPLLLIYVALLACLIPASRATQVDPLEVLRAE